MYYFLLVLVILYVSIFAVATDQSFEYQAKLKDGQRALSLLIGRFWLG